MILRHSCLIGWAYNCINVCQTKLASLFTLFSFSKISTITPLASCQRSSASGHACVSLNIWGCEFNLAGLLLHNLEGKSKLCVLLRLNCSLADPLSIENNGLTLGNTAFVHLV